MDLAALLGVLRRRWLPIVLCLAAGVAGASIVSRRTPDTYRAAARLLVNIPDVDTTQEAFQALQVSEKLLLSYAEVAKSRPAVDKVRTRLNITDSVGSLRRNITATPQNNTLLITVSATDHDPLRAQDIANATALVFVETVADLEKNKSHPIEARMIEPAVLPGFPISPRPRVNLVIGLLLGAAIGTALALVLETLDRAIKLPAQAAALFHAPVLGLIPKNKDGGADPSETANELSSPSGEAYRALRTSVRFIDPDKPLRTILITSPSAGEGKTTTAANFAVALAQSGDRVVLVDADLRRARIATLMGLPEGVGVTSAVTHIVSLQAALMGWRDLLAVLAAGPLPPNPSEILGSQAMANLLTELRGLADVVVIDAPPVLPVTDAVVLATQVDGVILVAQAGRTHRGLAGEARRRLDGVGANVIGCVLNGVSPSAIYGYYGYYDDERSGARPGLRGWGERLSTRGRTSRR